MPQKYPPLPLEPATREVRLHGRRLTFRKLPWENASAAEYPAIGHVGRHDRAERRRGDRGAGGSAGHHAARRGGSLAGHLAETWAGCDRRTAGGSGSPRPAAVHRRARRRPKSPSTTRSRWATPPGKSPAWRWRGSSAFCRWRCSGPSRARYIAGYALLAFRHEARRHLFLTRLAYMQASTNPAKVKDPEWLTDDPKAAHSKRPRISPALEELKRKVESGEIRYRGRRPMVLYRQAP